jgi:hypothetical protein
MSTIKQFGKGDNAYQRPLASHNSLKIIARKTLLNVFSTLICIIAQSRCKSRRVQMPKGMASQPPKVNTPN